MKSATAGMSTIGKFDLLWGGPCDATAQSNRLSSRNSMPAVKEVLNGRERAGVEGYFVYQIDSRCHGRLRNIK
jgi:hypothetical protein